MTTIRELQLFEKRQEVNAYRAAIQAVLAIHWAEYGTDIDASGKEFTEKWCNECEMPAWPCATREILHGALDRLGEQ